MNNSGLRKKANVQPTKEVVRGMVVAAFSLDGLHDHASDGTVTSRAMFHQKFLDIGKACVYAAACVHFACRKNAAAIVIENEKNTRMKFC